VLRANRTEVPFVQRDDGFRIQPLGECDHRCIGAAQRKVAVLFDEVGDSRRIVRRLFDAHSCEALQKLRLDIGPHARAWSRLVQRRCFSRGTGLRRQR
jgi:hypothetical protein